MLRPAGLALLLVLGAATPALAHKLKLFATAIGATIEGRVYFVGGGPALNVPVTLLDASGAAAGATFTLPPDGKFTLALPFRDDFTLTAEAQDGHVASFQLAASRLPESLPPSPHAAARAVMVAETVVSPTQEIGGAVSVPTDIIETTVARQIAPLADAIDELQASLGLRDILGGIGYLLGIFGLWALFARRKSSQ